MSPNSPITLQDINDMLGKLEPKLVHMNQRTYDIVLQKIDFEPINIVINNHLPDNQAVILPERARDFYQESGLRR